MNQRDNFKWKRGDEITDDVKQMAATIWMRRAQKAEAALESIAANTCCDKCQEAALVARKALKE